MECRDFRNLMKAVKMLEYDECMAALYAHNGSWDFFHKTKKITKPKIKTVDDLETLGYNCACVTFFDTDNCKPVDVYVTSVYLDGSGVMNLNAVDDIKGKPYPVEYANIYPCMMQFLTMRIPSTDEVKSVAKKQRYKGIKIKNE